jgi:ectoine hydroxylase-related dioxygenase (phytanoyl-CoA dioxygenase family)
MNIAVFMGEVMPINGPLMLIPRSHKHGVLAAGHDEEMTSYPLWTLDQETVTRLVQEAGMVAPTGRPGSVLMFHGNLVHRSAPNITPYPRRIVYLTLCGVEPHPQTDAPRLDRASRLHPDRAGGGYRAARLRSRLCRRECGRRPATGAVRNTGNAARPI